MSGPLVRDVSHRASIEELLNHSYLKSAEPIKETKKHLAVDLSSYEQLTPRTFKRVIMENLSNSNVNSKNMAPPPAYSQDSWKKIMGKLKTNIHTFVLTNHNDQSTQSYEKKVS